MSLLTLYARREPTKDQLAKKYLGPESLDVVIAKDPEFQNVIHRYAPDRKRPDRRYRFVNHNCYRFNLKWLPDSQ